MFRRLFVNVLAGAGAQALTAVAALWAIPQLLRIIGAAGYGTYSMAASVIGYVSIADMGLSNATLQRLARARASRDASAFGTAVGTSAVLLGGIGALITIALMLSAHPLGSLLAGVNATEAQRADIIACIRWCAAGVIPTLLRPVLEAVVAAEELLTRSYAVSTGANLARTVGAVVAASFWPSALAPVIVLVSASVLQFLILLPIARTCARDVPISAVRATRIELRSLLHASLPLWFSSGTTVIVGQLDRFIVSAWFGLATVGRYSVAQDLAVRLWVLPNILGKAYFPRLARELAHDPPEKHARTVRSYSAAALLPTLVVALPLAVLGRPLLSAWTGRTDLNDAALVFAYLLAGVVANSASVAAFAVLQIKLQIRAMSVPYGVLLLVHLLGCIILPRFLGAPGAALSWALAHAVCAVLLIANMRLRYSIRLLGDMGRLLGSGALTLCAMIAFLHHFPLPAINVHASAFHRIAAIAASALAWIAVGTTLACVGLSLGRVRRIRTVFGLPPQV